MRIIENTHGQKCLEVHYDSNTGGLLYLRCYDIITEMWMTVKIESLTAESLIKIQNYIGRWMSSEQR